MDTRRLHSFVRVVDAGSITRAADLLHIAQPALSQQMTALESLFGQQLLSRSKQGVEPTEAGRVLYRHTPGDPLVDACRAREEAEAGYIRRYRDGETPLTVSGLTEVLRAKGLTVDLP